MPVFFGTGQNIRACKGRTKGRCKVEVCLRPVLFRSVRTCAKRHTFHIEDVRATAQFLRTARRRFCLLCRLRHCRMYRQLHGGGRSGRRRVCNIAESVGAVARWRQRTADNPQIYFGIFEIGRLFFGFFQMFGVRSKRRAVVSGQSAWWRGLRRLPQRRQRQGG